MILGLDIGTKRTGVALSSGLLAAEHSTLTSSGDQLVANIVALCKQERIEKIVIGLPLNSDGSHSAQTEFVLTIVERLKAELQLPIILEDEFLTTAEAYRRMGEQGISREQAEQRIDQYSAKLILQQYLDSGAADADNESKLVDESGDAAV